MARPFTISKARWGHATTFMAEGLVLVATVLVYKLAADRLGDQGFESYTIVRRTTSFMQPGSVAIMAVAAEAIQAGSFMRAPIGRFDQVYVLYSLLP